MHEKSGVEILVILLAAVIGVFTLPIAIINLIANVNDYWSWVLGLTALILIGQK